jgi:hypothetical protein
MQVPASLPTSLSASDLIGGGAGQAISAEQPLWDLSPTRPLEYSIASSPYDIDSEESNLLAWAKRNHRFLTKKEVESFEKQAGVQGGGSEHDVWRIKAPKGAVIIRRTINDSYGFAHSSPFQYLQRLVDVSAAIPDAPISFLGMSKNSRGNGIVWTVQPYIEGIHPKDGELAAWLKKAGWSEVTDSRGRLIYEKSGVRIHDAHAGNFIKTKDGHIIPIDVFFEGLE